MFGKYKEIDLIGRGSSGVVYKVENEDGEEFALKKFEVAPETSEMEKNEALKKFLHQAEILKNFDRLDILECIEGFQLDGDDYIVTEFIDGGSLEKAMERGRVPTEDKRLLFGQLMYAINHVHQKGFAHRNLSLKKVLLSYGFNTSYIVLTDFEPDGYLFSEADSNEKLDELKTISDEEKNK